MSNESYFHRIKKFNSEFKQYILISQSKEEIIKLDPSSFFSSIGKRKLSRQSQYTAISNRAALVLEKLLEKEKNEHLKYISENKNENIEKPYLTLREIHSSRAIGAYYKTMLLFYVLPLIYLFKISKIRMVPVWRYVFMIPFIISYSYVNEMIKQYSTRKEAIKMLFLIENYYKDKPDFYEVYENFMKENKLAFKKIENTIN
jgi:hypothetical protein